MKQFCILLILSTTVYLPAQILNPDVDSIPMRDGKKLAADIYRPNTTDTFPTILVMTPYNRQTFRNGLPLVGIQLSSSNYAFVVVDWRCFYGSVSACPPGNNGEDGYDVIDWIAAQPWSDGKVGTWGPSALGRVQYLTLREQHPNHVCAVPLVAGSQYNYQEYFPGGVAKEAHIETLDALGFGLSPLLYANPVFNVTWQFAESSNLYPDEITKPCLLIGGWYDHNVDVMLELFPLLQSQSPAGADMKMLFGPWVHGGAGPAYVGSQQQGELSYPNAAGWSDSLALMFFDYWLRGITNGWDANPAMMYYQLGDDVWQQSSGWPPSGVVGHNIYLTDSSFASTAPATSGSRSFDYDPRDPSPTVGGPTLHWTLDQGPYDQAPLVEGRDDILVFRSEALSQPVTIKGSIQAHLFVSSDRKDTDFAVRLIDRYPDGRSMLITYDILRMRFRDGFAAADTSVMVQGTIYEIMIPLHDLAYTWLSGHAIQLDVTSSNWPQYNRNMNDGGPMYVAGDTLVAHNSVHFGGATSSYLVVPSTTAIVLATPGRTPIQDIHIFPSPAATWIHVPGRTTGELRVYDSLGRLILNAQGNLVDVSTLLSGTYLVEWRGMNTVAHARFIKL